MPPLTPEQLDHFRRRLLEAKASAQELLGQGAAEGKVEASGQTIGRLTRMDALQVQAMAQMSRHQLDIRLRQVEASLAQWDAGRYGICRSCHDPIGIQRLEILPEAPFCMACQEGFEG
ncbi:MAG: TraR/DksA family transcriptional regulator [Acidobacteriota bacterium]